MKSNPAKKVAGILKKAKTLRTYPTPPGQQDYRVWMGLCELLPCTGNTKNGAIRALVHFGELLNETSSRISSIDGMDSLGSQSIDPIIELFFGMDLDGAWLPFQNSIRPDMLLAIDFCSIFLDKEDPDPELPDEGTEEWTKDLERILAGVRADAGMPKKAKMALIEVLEGARLMMARYRVEGFSGFHKAFYEVQEKLQARETQLEGAKNTSVMKELAELLTKVETAVNLARSARRVIELAVPQIAPAISQFLN